MEIGRLGNVGARSVPASSFRSLFLAFGHTFVMMSKNLLYVIYCFCRQLYGHSALHAFMIRPQLTMGWWYYSLFLG